MNRVGGIIGGRPVCLGHLAGRPPQPPPPWLLWSAVPRFEFVDGVFGIMVRCTGCQCMVYGPGQDAHVCPAGLVVAVPCPPQPVELPEAV